MQQDNHHLDYHAKAPSRRYIIIARASLEITAAIALGWCVLVLPVAFDAERRRYTAAFMPLMRDAVEGMKLYSLPLLFVLGVFLGIIANAPAWVLGFASVASFFLWSVIDMAMGGDHNLLPIEWMFYALFGVFPTAGAYLGRLLRQLKRR